MRKGVKPNIVFLLVYMYLPMGVLTRAFIAGILIHRCFPVRLYSVSSALKHFGYYNQDGAFIYRLQCEHKRMYIGSTQNITQRIHEHFDGHGGVCTSKCKPLHILNIFKTTPEQMRSDERRETLRCMRIYGIHTVRGGPYVSHIITDEYAAFIRREIAFEFNLCFKCLGQGHFASDCHER
jgi:predicted GIY-YIG superfamily endonuclease